MTAASELRESLRGLAQEIDDLKAKAGELVELLERLAEGEREERQHQARAELLELLGGPDDISGEDLKRLYAELGEHCAHVASAPGQVLLREFMDARGTSFEHAKEMLAIESWVEFWDFIGGRLRVDEARARSIAGWTGTTAEFWLNLQGTWDRQKAVRSADGRLLTVDEYVKKMRQE